MKEIMVPYLLLVWLLFKFKILKRTPKNYFWTTFVGVVLLLILFVSHRFYSPADLTNSTTVKAPHAIVAPPFGQQIDTIYVEHNQVVEKGEILYTQRDDKLTSIKTGLNASKLELARSIEAQEIKLAQAMRDHKRNLGLEHHATARDVELSSDMIATTKADINVLYAKHEGLEAKLGDVEFELDRLTVRAPFKGMVTHVYIANGSRVGGLHLWDIENKFIEMRIPEQAYQNIKRGQFSEFYVDAYPAQVFRARVHSIVEATGEAQGNLMPVEQMVSGHIQRGAAPIGRTVILEVDSKTMDMLPIGSTGTAWISAKKPHSILGFMDIIGAAHVRLQSVKSILFAL
ncbi:MULTISPECIES: HlyD family secretion protein [Vibrio]|jgi:multidrug resistance efflux pump|uniref:HlyD family secretion protein n=1 Tax=Vibrio TaxID=662 RepID=UPI00352DF415